MIFKKISDLNAIELGECSTKSHEFTYKDEKYVAEVIAFHKPQQPRNGYIMQSTFAIYSILEHSIPCVHYEFFEGELTSDQIEECIKNAEKYISKYLKK